MDFKLEKEFSKAGILQEVDALKKQINDARPLPNDVEDRVMQKLRLEWNYNSNAIEGNKLNYGETTALLMHGITAKGKPLKDHLDIQGHNDAIDFLQSIIKENRPFTEADIRQLHEITLVEPYPVKAQTADGKSTTKQIKIGVYKTSPNHVKTITGEIHYYATPEETPAKMQDLMAWYSEIIKDKDVHPIVIAALFQHKFTEIHPFDDGNGRVARLVMNLILMRHSYPPAVIKMDDRHNYYSLLSQADAGNSWPFIDYIAELSFSSLQIYMRAIMGGDIDDDEDIDKEIALFKLELQSQLANKKEINAKGIYNLCIQEVLPLVNGLAKKAFAFNDLFFRNEYWINVIYKNITRNSKDRLNTGIDLNQGNLSQFFDFFLNERNKIEAIEFSIRLYNFKDEDNTFDVTGSLVFNFLKYEYEIINY
ncbi:MAG TPA: Fic family protein, partial [Candidatus Babeliaceae bacterium]|nr:Fic family protein [Candidatus Babeliaceae bacterium]